MNVTDAFVKFLGADWFDTPRYPRIVPNLTKTNTDLAQFLLTHNKPGPTISPFEPNAGPSKPPVEEQDDDPSFLSKAFDFLDQATGARIVRGAISDTINGEVRKSPWATFDILKSLGEHTVGDIAGLASSAASFNPLLPDAPDELRDFADKHNPDVRGAKLIKDLGIDNKWVQSIGGFAAEVALDPSSYVGIGLGKSIGKGGVESSTRVLEERAAGKATENAAAFMKPKAPEIVEPPVAQRTFRESAPSKFVLPMEREPSPNVFTSGGADEVGYNILNDPVSLEAMRKAKKSDDGWRAAQVRWGRNPDVEQAALDNAVTKGAWHDIKAQQKLAKAGKVTDRKGHISQISVGRVLEDIKEGNIPSWAPEQPEATGIARDIAVREADSQIDATLRKGSRVDNNPANQANLYNRLYDATAEVIKNDPTLAAKYGNKKGVIALNSPRVKAARRVLARGMLRTAEQHMIRMGKQPQYWDGTRVRLSDVLSEIGLEANDELATKVMQAWKTKDLSRIKEPAVAEAIYRSLARRPLHLSHMLEDLSLRAKELNNNILEHYTYPKAQEELAKLPDYAEAAVKNAGLTDEEAKAVRKLVANIVDVDKIPPEKLMETLGARLSQAVKEGRVDADALTKLNKEITKVLGQTKRELMTDISGHKVVDGIMLAFSTKYGRIPELKRFSQDVFQWGEMNAVARARWLRNMVHAAGNDPNTINTAFKIAQGMLPNDATFGITETKLASQMTDYFKTMLDSSGFSGLTQGADVASKSQIVMKDVNKHLKALGSHFQFQDGARVKDQFLGLTHDFSKDGEGWVGSWKLANPKGAHQDPVSFIYDMDQAIERTMKEYSVLDEFARTYGAQRGSAAYNPRLHTARLKSDRIAHDIFFHPEHRDMMQRLLNDIEGGLWRPQSKLIQHYARGLRVWKTGVTIYTPSHHIRNLIGDLHMMWWAGHNDPRNFIRAAKILHSQRQRYEAAMKMDTLDALKGLFDQDAMEWAKTEPGHTILRQNGVSLTAEQIYIAAHQHGLLLDANKYEDIFGQAPLENLPGAGKLPVALQKRIAEPLGGKAHHVAAKVLAENREHYVRLAHYVGAINKGLKRSTNLDKVLRDAAHEVRKWHPDGRDLTKFEQKARLAIPFYSWTRKAIPLIAQTAVTRPSKVLYYPRAQMALAQLTGVNEDPTFLDPFPDDQLFPEWIKAKGIGPIFDPASSNPYTAWFGKFGNNSIDPETGQETGDVIVNPSNPFQDVTESLTGFGGSPMEIGKSIFDQATPAIKIPAELTFNQTYSGAPITKDQPGGKGVFNYLFNQVPVVSMGNNVVEWEPGVTPPEGREGGMDKQALINYLTALGLRGTGPYEKTAEFEQREKAQ